MVSSVIFTVLLMAFRVAANLVQLNRPLPAFPISRHVNLTSMRSLVRHDQARAKTLKLRGANIAGNSRAVIDQPITNVIVNYVASVGIGSPPTTYILLVDCGSSNTWVGAGKPYVRTNTSVQTPNKVSVTYGSGSFSGTEFTDTVSLGNGLTVTKQSIGVASVSTGFDGVDGILGIGPIDLTIGTLSPATTSSIPTITDNLFSQGIISAHSIGISFEPTTVLADTNGVITWGGTESSKFTGSVTFIPVTTTAPSSEFWGIDLSIRYGNVQILPTTAGIVDTGTTLILIASNAFAKYKVATGGVIDINIGLLRITPSQFNVLQSLFLVSSSTTFELTPNAQIFPRTLNTAIGGVSGSIYLIVSDIGSSSGEGLDFILGYTFFERFYTVLDTGNNRIGIATTPFTNATSN